MEFVLTRMSFVLANNNFQTTLFQTDFACQWFEKFVHENVYFLDWRLWMTGMHLQHMQMHVDVKRLLLGIFWRKRCVVACLAQACARQNEEPNTATSTVAVSQDTLLLSFCVT